MDTAPLPFDTAGRLLRTPLAEIAAIRDAGVPLDFDADFDRAVRGRTVAIVGPSDTILGTGSGERIDAHDLVVRFNRSLHYLPMPDELSRDIGRRTDILYCNHAVVKFDVLGQSPPPTPWMNGIARNVRDPLGVPSRVLRRLWTRSVARESQRVSPEAFRGLRHFVWSNNNLSYTVKGEPEPKCAPAYRTVVTDFDDWRRKHDLESLQTRSLRRVTETLTNWLDGRIPTTGLLAILDLLTFDVLRLSVAGMTLFHGGSHLFQPNSRRSQPFQDTNGHDSYKELEWMRSLVKSFPSKLVVDDTLRTLLDD